MASEALKPVAPSVEGDMNSTSAVEESAREAKLAELDILRQALEEKERLAQESRDQMLRARAELENARRRWEKERVEALDYGRYLVLRAVFSLWDQLGLCLKALQADKQIDVKIKEGFELFEKNQEKFLRDQGVLRVPAEPGQAFDPLHQEALRLEESDLEEGRIVSVEQEGYFMGERLLRPARAVVSKKKRLSG